MPLAPARYLHDAIDIAFLNAIDSGSFISNINWASKSWKMTLAPNQAQTSRGTSYGVDINGVDMGIAWEYEQGRGKKIAHRMEIHGLLKDKEPEDTDCPYCRSEDTSYTGENEGIRCYDCGKVWYLGLGRSGD